MKYGKISECDAKMTNNELNNKNDILWDAVNNFHKKYKIHIRRGHSWFKDEYKDTKYYNVDEGRNDDEYINDVNNVDNSDVNNVDNQDVNDDDNQYDNEAGDENFDCEKFDTEYLMQERKYLMREKKYLMREIIFNSKDEDKDRDIDGFGAWVVKEVYISREPQDTEFNECYEKMNYMGINKNGNAFIENNKSILLCEAEVNEISIHDMLLDFVKMN